MNLLIPAKFKTKNGYTCDKNGINLGSWVSNIRRGIIKISDEQIVDLNKIGMVWDIKKNTSQISELCSQYSIDYNANKKVLGHMSVLEFEVKIAFLIDMNIPYLNDKGKLHNIFSVSSADLQEEYGVSLTDLMDNYGKKETK